MKMATKWQKAAEIGRKRTLLQNSKNFMNSNSSTAVADKGQFVVYTMDNRRSVIPVPYLYSDIFRELLRMSEEEFGLPRDGPIMFPCDSFFPEYVMSLLQRGLAQDKEKVKLMLVITSCRSLSSSLHQGLRNQHVLVSN